MPRMDDEEVYRHIGQRIRVRRILMGIDQKHLSEAVVITIDMLRRFETGESKMAASTLNEVAAKLGVPFWYFFDDAA